MKKIILIVFILSGCAFQQMDRGLTDLQGKNIKQAISYLGYPDNEQKIAGDTIYTWGTNYNVSSITPVTNYSSGTASAYGSGGSAFGTYSGTTTSYIPTTINHRCILKLITNDSGTIINSQYEGNQGGCSSYGQSLNRLSQDIENTEKQQATYDQIGKDLISCKSKRGATWNTTEAECSESGGKILGKVELVECKVKSNDIRIVKKQTCNYMNGTIL